MKTPLAIISCDKEILELADSLGEFSVRGFFDANAKAKFGAFTHLGSDSSWSKIKKDLPKLRVVMAVDPPVRKKTLAAHYGMEHFVSLISSEAVISPSAHLGQAALVQQGVRILADAKIGAFCKINVNAVIHHDCSIGDFCTLAPGALLLGAVTVENEVYVGAGAIVLPKLKIGKGATIGAGAVVTHDVPPGKIVKGVPAK